jgi:hypothetical protein
MPRGRPRSRISVEEAEERGLCYNCRIRPRRAARTTCTFCSDAGKRWRQKNPTGVRIARLAAKLTATNIGLEEYQGIILKQHGCCAVCKKKTVLLVDHDHQTGKFRGLICRRCNLVLGMAEDDPDCLRAAADYLTGTAG